MKILLGLLLAGLLLLSPAIVQAPNDYTPDENDYLLIENNSLQANCSPNTPYSGETLTRIVTAYNPVKNQTDNTPCISASGLNVCETSKRIVASNEFRFGTRILIDGRVYYVEDRMSISYPYRIDLLMFDYQEARNWGVQKLEILLLD